MAMKLQQVLLALYKRGREEDGLTVWKSGSLQANLRALEIADAINSQLSSQCRFA